MPVTAANGEVAHGRFRVDEELGVAPQIVDLLEVGSGVRFNVVERAPVADDQKLRNAVVAAGHDVGAEVAGDLLDPVNRFTVGALASRRLAWRASRRRDYRTCW